MCGKCQASSPVGDGRVSIDWSRIPEGLNEVRQLPSGAVFAGNAFRVLLSAGGPAYYRAQLTSEGRLQYANAPVLEVRPEVKKDYVVMSPRVAALFLNGYTRADVANIVAKTGYGDDFVVYELVVAAKCEQVPVTKTETQLVWK